MSLHCSKKPASNDSIQSDNHLVTTATLSSDIYEATMNEFGLVCSTQIAFDSAKIYSITCFTGKTQSGHISNCLLQPVWRAWYKAYESTINNSTCVITLIPCLPVEKPCLAQILESHVVGTISNHNYAFGYTLCITMQCKSMLYVTCRKSTYCYVTL